jgi:hypothetical protein
MLLLVMVVLIYFECQLFFCSAMLPKVEPSERNRHKTMALQEEVPQLREELEAEHSKGF